MHKINEIPSWQVFVRKSIFIVWKIKKDNNIILNLILTNNKKIVVNTFIFILKRELTDITFSEKLHSHHGKDEYDYTQNKGQIP